MVSKANLFLGANPAVHCIFCFLAAKRKRMPFPSGLGIFNNDKLCTFDEHFSMSMPITKNQFQ